LCEQNFLKYLKVSVYYSLIKLNIFDANKTSLKGRCHHMKQLLKQEMCYPFTHFK